MFCRMNNYLHTRKPEEESPCVENDGVQYLMHNSVLISSAPFQPLPGDAKQDPRGQKIRRGSQHHIDVEENGVKLRVLGRGVEDAHVQ